MIGINKISDAELEIMKVLWDKKIPMKALDIFHELKKNMDWGETTARTLIRRLKEKGFLIQEKREIFYYSPAISENQYMKEQTKSFLDKVYGGKAKGLLASLFEDDYISSNDVEELKKFWKERREKNE